MMPTFEWKGSRAGQMQSGVLNADSKEAAGEILRRQRIEAPSILAPWLSAGATFPNRIGARLRQLGKPDGCQMSD